MGISSSRSRSKYPVVFFKDVPPESMERCIEVGAIRLEDKIKKCEGFDVDGWFVFDDENKLRFRIIEVFPHILKRLNVTTQWSYSYDNGYNSYTNGWISFRPILSAAMLDTPGSI
jgi:hypothetical protein